MNQKSKRTLIGLGAMLVGTVLVVTGFLGIPVKSIVLILVGGALGFAGYRIYDNRKNAKPDDLVFG